jgi:3-hydroxyacyl-[acyl-carrier-protein] dehydratase
MRFSLLDRIVDMESGKRITAVRRLRADEEYLRDHFPRFPVMPGVLMLESLYQASMWLVRCSEDFAHSAVVLREARNVKYADFVKPGQVLTVQAEILRQDAETTQLKAHGKVDDVMAVSGLLILERFNLADRFPDQAPIDNYARREMRDKFVQLCDPRTVSP